jgi:RNA recognition motif-containing protein
LNIIVRDLPRYITEKELLQLFLPFGEVSAHNLVKEPGTGKSKGFGFVEMPDKFEAKDAIRALNNKMIGDTRLKVKVTARKYVAPFERRDRSRSEFTERRSFSSIVRTEERATKRPATPQRSASGSGWTRNRAEAEGGNRTSRYSERGATTSQPEGKYRARPAKTGVQKAARPFMGPRKAKRSRTPARPVKIGRSGARQNKSAKRGKRQ